ncbi:PAS domain S-box protein [Mucilaginibacter arboris]|uniref:histidine kinase n=1 Tax=Mucilaginibacter arboris TaxID=2682090 RepID=A0A7K1SVQ2_9SPHI|nr:PAS domain S-box protein [Mucilaginibacter arboris]MVN21406.1 PAS domain S-box protein [Mucilaginibacter arboris]
MLTNTDKFLQGGGKMGELIRSTNWSRTSLGGPAAWPDSLKSALSICLNSGFPIAIYWGEDFTLIYNDAWSVIPGNKHPWALGKPGAVVWPEIWDGLDAEFKNVLANGESIRSEDALLPMKRYGYTEECYFDYTLSPIIAADGSVGGVFNAVVETTYRVINERRNQILHQLLQLNAVHTFTEGIETGTKILETAKKDLPFCLLFTAPVDSKDEVTLSAAVGIELKDVQDITWPLEKTIRSGKSVHIKDLTAYLQAPVASCWPENCLEALIVPLSIGETKITGCLVAGISSRRKLDHEYQHFIESVGIYIGTAISKGYNYMQEQKNQHRILESENRFRSMMDQSPVAMVVFRGEEMKVSKANKTMLNMLGKTEAVIGKKLLEVMPELEGQPLLDILYNVYHTGQPYFGYDMQVQLNRNGNFEEAYFDFSYSPLLEGGKITGVLEVATEVTESVKARQKLFESEALFRGITAASPTALWITDEFGNISYVNETWIRWTGKPLENHLGAGWLDTVHEEDVKHAYAAFADDFKKRRYHENQFRVLHTNGQERWVVCTGNPQYDEAQRFKGFIGACVDTTEQKQLQQQKDNFLGIASHELKTPVTSIKAYAQVLEMMFRRDGDTKKADMLGKLDKQVNRLNNLIADLLDVTKIHTGKMQFNVTGFDFNQLVEEVIEDVQRTSFRHKIKKQLYFQGMVFGDTDRISQVITNLLTNAIKYSPDANEVIVCTEQKGAFVELCVQDFGIGISQDKKDKVFEQFYRVSGAKEHTFPGLGLGLYISCEIVKRLNGKIWVNSIEGKGSTFCFSLPLPR